MTDQELKHIECMEKYGGSFVKALANAFLRAGSSNFHRLKDAFPDYWSDYSSDNWLYLCQPQTMQGALTNAG